VPNDSKILIISERSKGYDVEIAIDQNAMRTNWMRARVGGFPVRRTMCLAAFGLDLLQYFILHFDGSKGLATLSW